MFSASLLPSHQRLNLALNSAVSEVKGKLARPDGASSNPDATNPDALFQTLEEWNQELERLAPLPVEPSP
jgi:hypothetical protein